MDLPRLARIFRVSSPSLDADQSHRVILILVFIYVSLDRHIDFFTLYVARVLNLCMCAGVEIQLHRR